MDMMLGYYWKSPAQSAFITAEEQPCKQQCLYLQACLCGSVIEEFGGKIPGDFGLQLVCVLKENKSSLRAITEKVFFPKTHSESLHLKSHANLAVQSHIAFHSTWKTE